MVARAAMVVGGSKAIGGASMLLLNLWVARHLAPAEYGVFAIATTCLLLLDGVLGSSVDAAVIRVAADSRAGAGGAGRAGVAIKLAAGAVVAGAAGTLFWLARGDDAARIAVVVAAGGTGMLVLRSVQVQLQLEERFPRYAAADLVHTAFRVGGVAVALAQGTGSAATLLAWYAAAPWAAAALFSIGPVRAWATSMSSRLDARSVARVTAVTLTTTAVGAVVARLDLFVIGAVGTPAEAGIFAAASTLAMIPAWFGAYLAPAFSGRIVPYCREGRMRPFFWDVQRLLVVLALAGALAGAVVAPPLIEHALPASYARAAHVVPVLLVTGAAGLVTFPLVLHTLLFLSPRTYVVMDLASLPIVLPLYVIAARADGAAGVAYVTSAAALIKAMVAQAAAAAAVRRAEADAVLSGAHPRWAVERHM